MCRIMADVRPIKTPAQLTWDFWHLMGFLVSGNVRNRGTPKKWHPWPTMTSFQANFHPLECKLMKGQVLSWGPSASCLLLNSAIVGWWNPHVLLQSVQSQVLLLQCHKNPDLSHVLLLGSAPLGSPFLVASHEPTRGPSPLDRSWPRFPGWDIPMKSHRKIWEHPSIDRRWWAEQILEKSSNWSSMGISMGPWIFHRTYMGIPIMEHGFLGMMVVLGLGGDSYQPVYGIGLVFMWLWLGTDWKMSMNWCVWESLQKTHGVCQSHEHTHKHKFLQLINTNT